MHCALRAIALHLCVWAGHGLTVSVTQFGGKGDGKFDNAKAFAAAVSAVESAGGSGVVFVPTGRFSTSPFNLSSHVTLLLGSGATIAGSDDIKSWPLLPALPSFPGGPRYAPIVGCYNCSAVVIATNGTGEAAFDGSGPPWWLAQELKTLKGDRPHMLEFFGCDGVDVSGVHMFSSPFWTVREQFCTPACLRYHILFLSYPPSPLRVGSSVRLAQPVFS